MKTRVPTLLALATVLALTVAAPATEAQIDPKSREYQEYKKLAETFREEQKLFDEQLNDCRGYLRKAILDAMKANNRDPNTTALIGFIQAYSERGLLNLELYRTCRELIDKVK